MSLKVSSESSNKASPSAPELKPKKQGFLRWWAERTYEGYLIERNPIKYCAMKWKAESSSKQSEAQFMRECQKICETFLRLVECHRKN